jgi:predicted secreted hydrolase
MRSERLKASRAAWRNPFGRGVRFVLCALLLVASASRADDWKTARADYPWSFPRDHWARRGYRTEWWYFTGNLAAEGEPARRFGYQFTFFRIGLLPGRPGFDSAWAARDLIMGHAAVGDPASGRHVFSELLYREAPFLAGFGEFPDSPIAWSLGPPGTDGRWTLRWNGTAFDLEMRDDARGTAFRLSARPLKPLVFQGPGGCSRKGAGPAAASQYYSFTRLETEGELRLDGKSLRVRGESWMDREFGSNMLSPGQVGWDWFSLRLDDGREIMLYLLRDAGGRVDFASGTLVDGEGRAKYLKPDDWVLRVTGRWKSPRTGAEYPARWTLDLPGERIRAEIRPEMADQENRGRLAGGLFYWEGAVSILGPGGDRVGSGYVELTGYGTGNRPGI